MCCIFWMLAYTRGMTFIKFCAPNFWALGKMELKTTELFQSKASFEYPECALKPHLQSIRSVWMPLQLTHLIVWGDRVY